MAELSALELLKINLSISLPPDSTEGAKIEELLSNYIDLAQESISREGITLDEDSHEDNMLVMLYADYLYRHRGEVLTTMPRQLRYLLNNRLLSEKAGEQ